MSRTLTDLLFQGASLRTLIDAAEDFLGNPLAFIDRNQNEPLLSKSYPQDDIDDKIYRRRNISTEEYQKDTDYVTARSLTGRPHIIAWPNIRRRRMICGSIIGGRHMGGIRLPDVGRPLEELDSQDVIQTAQVMGAALILNGWPTGSSMDDGQSFLWSILNQKVNPSFLSNRMIYPLFPEGCQFCLLWYPCDAADLFLPSIQSYCYAPAEQGLAVLADFQELTEKRAAIEEELSARGLLAGCSDSFTSVNDIYRQFRLARSVYAYAGASGQATGLAFFNDYRLYEMLSFVAAHSEPSLYIHDSLPALRRYDREKDTQYMDTVRAYLDCNRNIARTAERLCIHKNTVFYRLGRLKEDFGLDLENTRTLANVYCSLRLMELE